MINLPLSYYNFAKLILIDENRHYEIDTVQLFFSYLIFWIRDPITPASHIQLGL
jgi:hypothetical protein